ncbi:hypothetical protein BG011_008283 [Mortierella polycephala]|uniref:Uncharacterized protein n=1 Tax=Mortierella polycephala TaxID=41804 RepID=A0A9P6PPX7_9FUNG|nr:hypothetical protein BG011_008283 [Mortierella polycephala]
MYSQKPMHYTRASNNGGALKHSSNHEPDDSHGPRPFNDGRSSSHSSNSSANGGGVGLNGTRGVKAANVKAASFKAASVKAANGGSSYTSHQQSGANASPPGRATAASASAEKHRSGGAHDHHADYSSGAHSWPILFAVLPPLGSLAFGKAEIFSDILTLTLIAFFIYNIIKVPWELYYAARTRRILLSSASVNAPTDPVLEQRRKSAASSLRHQEFLSLLFVLASPFLGGYTLQYLKTFFSSYENFLSALNIELFIIASGIRPLSHLIGLLKSRALFLQEQAHYPDSEVEQLKRKVASIEAELAQLRRGYATKRDVLQVQDNVEPTLHHLTKQIKRHDKKENLLRSYTEERFSSIDDKMREYDAYLAYRITEDQHRSSLLFLPINILVAMVSYCTFFLPARLAGIAGHKQQPMLKNSPVPAAIGDGALDDTMGHRLGSQHHDSRMNQLSGRQPSHNPIASTRETARLY